MSKKPSIEKDQIETELEEVNGNVTEEPVQLAQSTVITTVTTTDFAPKDKAYSIVFDEKLARWMAVEVTFDYQSGVMGGIKVIESNPSKYMIIERFQVLVGRNLL